MIHPPPRFIQDNYIIYEKVTYPKCSCNVKQRKYKIFISLRVEINVY